MAAAANLAEEDAGIADHLVQDVEHQLPLALGQHAFLPGEQIRDGFGQQLPPFAGLVAGQFQKEFAIHLSHFGLLPSVA